jgi:O-Antigen ligase
MRRAVPLVATACALGAPTVLAFFSGGYFSEPRVIAGLVVWSLVLALSFVGRAPLPRSLPGALALGGLAALAAWSAVSILWAPLAGPAAESVQRLVLYVGALVLGFGALRSALALRAVEPALAGGAVVVIGYGLSGRLLPGIVELSQSARAGGRLEQPITYWNAEGALAAMGLVLSARVAGDPTRPLALRVMAAAAAPILGAGTYLTYSRGAIAVAVLGLVVLVALMPTRAQLRAAALTLVVGVVAAACCSMLPAVASLEGAHPARDGAVALTILSLLAVGAALFTARRPGMPDGELRRARLARPVAAAAVAAVGTGLVVAGLAETPSAAERAGANAERLVTASSNRYEYWRVALEAFEDRPLSGIGAGGFRVRWLQERSVPEAIRNVHSLELETAAELGLVGLLAFAVMLGGVLAAARRAVAVRPAAAAGPAAALLAWGLHASIDWDWQVPAVTLPAITLAAALVALSELSGGPREG